MSAMPLALPRRTPTTTPRPELTLVPVPRRKPGQILFLLFCLSLLIGGLAAVLILNTGLAEGSFEEHRLELELAQMAEHRSGTLEQLSKQGAPAMLAKKARELGMVPAAGVSYIRLADGSIIGTPTPAGTANDQETNGEDTTNQAPGETDVTQTESAEQSASITDDPPQERP